MISARTPNCHRALVSTLAAAGVIAGGLRAADGGVPGEGTFRRMLAELEKGWTAVAAVPDWPAHAAAARESPATPPVAPPVPAERVEVAQATAAAAANGASAIEELQRAIAERDAVIADLRQRVGQLERWWRAMAPADQMPLAGGTADPASTAAPAAPIVPAASVQDSRTDDATAEPAVGEFEVAQEVIDRALERALVQTGALLLPAGTIEVDPSFTYVRREDGAPILVANGDQAVVATGELRRNEFEAALTLRLGLPFDSQLEVEVPYRYEDLSNVMRVGFTEQNGTDRSGRGFGDVGVGFAKGLLRERGWRPDLIGRVRWDTDTGQTDDGVVLGSGFNEITGSLTAVKRQDPLVFVGTASYTTSLENDGIDPGDELGLSLGTVLAASPQTSLRFFLAQKFAGELEVDGEEIDGSDQVSTSLIIGASSVIAPRILLDVTAGVGLTEDAPDYSINVSLPIRFSLPPLF